MACQHCTRDWPDRALILAVCTFINRALTNGVDGHAESPFRSRRSVKHSWLFAHFEASFRTRGEPNPETSSPEIALAALRLHQGARFTDEYDLNILGRHEVRIENHLGPEAGKADR